MNKIIIKNLKVFAYHGVHQEEKLNGQNFILDAELETEKLKAYQTDNIKDAVNYSEVISEITKVFTKNPYNLLEKVAEQTVEHIFNTFEKVIKIDLTVKKPEAPINADFEYVAIKISRKRDDFCG